MANPTKKPLEGFLPLRVSTFDDMIDAGGIEKGNTILVSGGCGSGKTIFAMQSIYNGALNGEKGAYISLEENADKVVRHMSRNFGWDIAGMQEKGLISIQKIDPFELSKDIETTLRDPREREKLFSGDKYAETGAKTISLIDSKKIEIPFKPDRIVIDSLSALSIAFNQPETYRLCLQLLVTALNRHDSVNILTSETEQEPMIYSKLGLEEFLTDGVIVLYNIRRGQLRRRAIEIVKLRCSDHLKELVPYVITGEGIKVLRGEKIY